MSFISCQKLHAVTKMAVWHFRLASNSKKMESAQERALRAANCERDCDTRSSYEGLLKKAKLPTQVYRRFQGKTVIMYKAKYYLCPPYISDLFKQDKCCYGLRNSGDFVIPRFNTSTYGKHSLRYLGSVIWTKLSTVLKDV